MWHTYLSVSACAQREGWSVQAVPWIEGQGVLHQLCGGEEVADTGICLFLESSTVDPVCLAAHAVALLLETDKVGIALDNTLAFIAVLSRASGEVMARFDVILGGFEAKWAGSNPGYWFPQPDRGPLQRKRHVTELLVARREKPGVVEVNPQSSAGTCQVAFASLARIPPNFLFDRSNVCVNYDCDVHLLFRLQRRASREETLCLLFSIRSHPLNC